MSDGANRCFLLLEAKAAFGLLSAFGNRRRGVREGLLLQIFDEIGVCRYVREERFNRVGKRRGRLHARQTMGLNAVSRRRHGSELSDIDAQGSTGSLALTEIVESLRFNKELAERLLFGLAVAAKAGTAGTLKRDELVGKFLLLDADGFDLILESAKVAELVLSVFESSDLFVDLFGGGKHRLNLSFTEIHFLVSCGKVICWRPS